MIAIRQFVSADIPDILRIEHDAHPAGQWNAADYEWLNRERGGIVLVALLESGGLEGGGLAGFVAARGMGPEAEMLNLAVDSSHRRHGIGRSLVEALHRRLRDGATERVFLEVRPSNLPAQQLYRSLGYAECGRRRGYYASNGEDALVFEIRLRAASGSGASDEPRSAGGGSSALGAET
jgi:ribosomal-protein-alanine N-acetyltransferase